MGKEIQGQGPPDEQVIGANINQKYRDAVTGHVWRLTEGGWVKAFVVRLDVLPEQKNRWVAIARAKGMTLEDWIFSVCDLP